MVKGRINSFQSLGTVDGPGLRCVVFMQGCPLRCVCCHNPDTWEFGQGEETDVESLVAKIMRFTNYFGESGGVTVSGGEPLAQAEFVTELFKTLKTAGINTALDTSGCIWNDKINELLRFTDLVILDYKYSNPDSYLKYTKCDMNNVQLFLEKLQERNIRTWIRRVIIPGLNDNEEETRELRKTIDKYPCVEKTELLPFRKLCIGKYENLGIEFPLADVPEPDGTTMKKLQEIID